jgi:phosphoserine phosphatase
MSYSNKNFSHLNQSSNPSMTAYLFDIDGVITNPQTRQIGNPELITHIVSRLEKNNPIGLISGRAYPWIVERVLQKIEHYVAEHTNLSPNILDNLFVSGEFGGVGAVHVNGKRKEFIKRDVIIPPELRNQLKNVAKQFTQYAFIDEEKQTQFSMEMNYDRDEQTFSHNAREIAKTLCTVVGDNASIEVHVDRIGINVKYRNVNKHYATDQFLGWLQEKKRKPQKFYVFGDSVSDLEIGEALHKHNLPFTFVFVGEKELIEEKHVQFPFIVTQGHCDEGTLEFLEQNRI